MAGTKLLPCPFCGGEAKSSGERFENTILSWVYCTRCGAAGGYRHTEAEAIAAWNSRAPMSDEDLKILLDELGVSERTCRMTDRGECSECGAYIVRAWTEVHDFNGDMKRIDLRSHNYCPNCGARVTPKNYETTPKVVSE